MGIELRLSVTSPFILEDILFRLSISLEIMHNWEVFFLFFFKIRLKSEIRAKVAAVK